MSFAQNRKLLNFYKEKAKCAARYKSFLSFLDGTPDAEISQFIRMEAEKLFSVFFDKFLEEEQVVKKGKNHTQEVLQLLDTLKLMIRNLAENIAKRWKFQMFARIILKTLFRGNLHEVRMSAFECLLMLMDIFGDDPDDNVQGFTVPAFSKAIDLSPFTGNDATPLNNSDALCPTSEPLQKSDVSEMWDFLLTFATSREDNFEFWYELLKSHYLSIFYADECMSIGLPVDQKTTFAVCPAELQVIIIKHLPAWDANKYLARTIWSEVNSPIMLGYCTHACKMPLSYSKETLLCIKLYSSVFLTRSSVDNPMRVHWTNWLTSLSRVFFIASQPASPELTTHKELCENVIDVFSFFTLDLYAEMGDDHWVSLQTLLVDMLYELLSSNDCTMVLTLAEVMASPLLDILFITWIRSPVTTPEMWSMLEAKLIPLLVWKPVVTQWSEKTELMTSLVVNYLYANRESMGSVVANPGKVHSRRTTLFSSSNTGPDRSGVLSEDKRVSMLEWDAESVLDMWFRILHVIGNPNLIVTGELFQLALGCLSLTIDMLQNAQYTYFPDENEMPPVDVFEVFCPWLFNATLVDGKRSRGAVVAYTLLCELFLQMRDVTLDPALLTHFYRVLITGLTGGHSSIAWCVIRNARALFYLNLPGAEVVMPFMVDQVEVTFGPKKTVPPEKVQTRFVALLSAMVCYSAHFEPFCPEDSYLMDRVVTAFGIIADCPKVAVPRTLCSTISGLAFCIFQEVANGRRPEIISKASRIIVHNVLHENAEVWSVALQMLSSLSHIAADMHTIDSSLVNNMVLGLCQAGYGMLKVDRNDVVPSILFTILEVLLASNCHDRSVATSVFELCDMAMCHHRTGNTAVSRLSMKPSVDKTKTSAKEPDKEKRGGFVGKLRKKDKAGSASTSEVVLEAEVPAEIRDVHEAGETVAEMLCVHLDNFPAPAGPEISECREYDGKKHQGDDDMNPNTLFWIFGDNALLSMRQVEPSKAGPIVRITLRNMTGRFVWDAQLRYEEIRTTFDYGLPANPVRSDPTFDELTERKLASTIDMGKAPRPAGVLPTPEVEYQQDGLFETLSYLHESHSTIVPSNNVAFTEPYDTMNLEEEELSYYETSLEFQDEDERMHVYARERGTLKIEPQRHPTTGSSFHLARMFFAQMGFTSDNMLQQTLCLVDNSDKFRRTLKELDKRMVREHIKVACLRVARGHDTQKEMLHLESRSVGFRDLVDAMAWSVDLATHVGFGGQLPKRGSAPYWASPSVELVFHDTTRMPTDEADEQQIQKKKHVGNDHVSVIWSEHNVEYDTEVIRSQFNFVHVIIYPLQNGLHRIQVKKKENIPCFGPLVDGALVSPQLLPSLVRATLINANRVVRQATTQGSIVRPVQARAKLLQEIAVKYRKEMDFQAMMMEIMASSITPGYEPPAEPEDTPLASESGMSSSRRPAGRRAAALSPRRSPAVLSPRRAGTEAASTSHSRVPAAKPPRSKAAGRGSARAVAPSERTSSGRLPRAPSPKTTRGSSRGSSARGSSASDAGDSSPRARLVRQPSSGVAAEPSGSPRGSPRARVSRQSSVSDDAHDPLGSPRSSAVASPTTGRSSSGSSKKLPAPPPKKALPSPVRRNSVEGPASTRDPVSRTAKLDRHVSGPAGLVSRVAPRSAAGGVPVKRLPTRSASIVGDPTTARPSAAGRGSKLAPRGTAPKPRTPPKTSAADDADLFE